MILRKTENIVSGNSQIKLNNLEQAELFSLIKLHDLVQENLKENYGALSDKESRELEDLLRKVANAIGALKKLMNEYKNF